MRLLLALYMVVTLTIVFCRIDRWPFSNFAVFRGPKKIEYARGYRWHIQSDGEAGGEYYDFPFSKLHDHFAENLDALRNAGQEQRARIFAEKYVANELRMSGRLKAGISVLVIRSETLVMERSRPDARVCWVRSEGGFYCVIDKEVYKLAF